MTLNVYVAYETMLRENGFRSTELAEKEITQPRNWVRTLRPQDDQAEIARVYLHLDGTFKAYRQDGNIACHGAAAWELDGCLG